MSHFQKRLALLKQRPFLAYMIGLLCAAIGNGLGYIAMSWIIVSRHDNVAAMAILMACFWGPTVFLGPLMGVLADRLSRKWMMTISNAVRACVLIGFSLYLMRHFHANTIYLLMLCIGISFSAFFSSAFAFMRELVPAEELMYANATIDSIYEIGNLVGMGSAGLLIAWTSDTTAILINGLTFLAATASMFFIPKSALRHGAVETCKKIAIIGDFKEGLNYLYKNKKLILIYTIQLLIFMTFLTTPLLLVPFSKSILHATVTQFGIIEAFASIGIVVGGLFMPWISERFGLMRTIMMFCFVLMLTFLYFGFNRSISMAAMMYFFIGFSGAVWPLIITRAQMLTAHSFQGRVQSTFNSLSGACMLIFYFSIGSVSKFFGVEHLYLVEVLITTIAILFLMRARKVFA